VRLQTAEGVHKANEGQLFQFLHSENVAIAEVNDVGNVLWLLPNCFQLEYHEHGDCSIELTLNDGLATA
jgi:hypothetical protein